MNIVNGIYTDSCATLHVDGIVRAKEYQKLKEQEYLVEYEFKLIDVPLRKFITEYKGLLKIKKSDNLREKVILRHAEDIAKFSKEANYSENIFIIHVKELNRWMVEE